MANLSTAEYEFASKLTWEQLPAKLRCAVCNKAVLDAMKTECCDTTMCKKCATSMTGACPICEFKITGEIVREDKRTRTTLKAHVKGELQKRNNAAAAALRQAEETSAESSTGIEAEHDTQKAAQQEQQQDGVSTLAVTDLQGLAETGIGEGRGSVDDGNLQQVSSASVQDEVEGGELHNSEAENIATPTLEDTTASHDTVEGEEPEDDDGSDIDIITERPGYEQQNSFAKSQNEQNGDGYDQVQGSIGAEMESGNGHNTNSNQQQGFNMDFSNMNGFNPMLAMQAGMMPPFNMMPNMMGMPNMGMDPSMMLNMANMMNSGMMNGNMMGGNFGAMSTMGNMDDSNSYNQYGNRFDNQGYGQQPYFNDNRQYRGRGRGGRFFRGRGQSFNRGRGGWNRNQQYQNYQGQDQMPYENDMNDHQQGQLDEQPPHHDVRDDQQQQLPSNQHDHDKQNDVDAHVQTTNEDSVANGKDEHPYKDLENHQEQDDHKYKRQHHDQWRDEQGARDDETANVVAAPPVNAPSGPKAMREGLPNNGRYSRQTPAHNHNGAGPGKDSRPSSSNETAPVIKIPTGPASMKVPKGPAADVKIPKGPSANRREQDNGDRSVDERNSGYDRPIRDDDHDHEDRKHRSHRQSRSRSPLRSHREKRHRSRSTRRRAESGSDNHRDRDRDYRKEKRRTRDYDDDRDRDDRKRTRSKSPDHDHSSRRHRRRDEKDRSSRRERSRDKHHRSSTRDEEASRKTKSSHRSSRKERNDDENGYDDYAAPVFNQKQSGGSRSLAVLEEPQDDIGFKIKGSKSGNDLLSRTSVDPYAEERERMKRQRTQRDAERRHGKRERSEYEVEAAGDDNASRRKKRSKPRAKYEDEIHHGDHEQERERSRWTDR